MVTNLKKNVYFVVLLWKYYIFANNLYVQKGY